MRLRDDLKELAHAAPAPPDPDQLLHRAQRIRHRRAIVAPAAAVVAVLVLTITYLSGVDGSGPTMAVSFRWEQAPNASVDAPVEVKLDQIRGIIQDRARMAGLAHVRTRLEDGRIILEFDATSQSVDLEQLAAPGRLELRKVLNWSQGHGGILRSPKPPGPEASTLDEVIAKIGPETWARVSALDSVSGELFRAFADLTPREVRLLPTRVQFYVMTVGCDQLGIEPGQQAPGAAVEITACLGDGDKLLLDGAAMSGADIADAMPETVKRPDGSTDFQVRLKLTRAGQDRWTDLTTRVALRNGCVPEPGSAHCRLAFVLDGQVLSAPEILRGLRPNEAVISGLYTDERARMVAATLGPRELPPGVKPVG